MIRVLLVEDDDIVAKVIQYYLGQEGGYEVVRTRNAGEALYAARDAAKPTYGYEHYIGFLDKTDKITFERYNNTTGGRTGANVSGASSVGWKHVDVVVSDESTTMYVNGTLVNSVEAKEA